MGCGWGGQCVLASSHEGVHQYRHEFVLLVLVTVLIDSSKALRCHVLGYLCERMDTGQCERMETGQCERMDTGQCERMDTGQCERNDNIQPVLPSHDAV